jgi:hypothetical protein
VQRVAAENGVCSETARESVNVCECVLCACELGGMRAAAATSELHEQERPGAAPAFQRGKVKEAPAACRRRRSLAGLVPTVLALKFGYYLNGEKATLISIADDIRILAYVKVGGSQ